MSAYEIHIGRTDGPDRARPFALRRRRSRKAPLPAMAACTAPICTACSPRTDFRRAYLDRLGIAGSDQSYSARVDQTLDALADHIEAHLDVEGLLALAR